MSREFPLRSVLLGEGIQFPARSEAPKTAAKTYVWPLVKNSQDLLPPKYLALLFGSVLIPGTELSLSPVASISLILLRGRTAHPSHAGFPLQVPVQMYSLF